MTSYCGWPYATKAIFQHEFVADHLNVWVIFRFFMNTSLKPPETRWIVDVDDVQKAVSASEWTDAWTLKLTVPDITARPDRVLVEYDGPDENLKITWGKQWEPFGPILSEDKTLIAEFSTGMCLFYYGTLGTIPEGFHNCDGTNGTPDTQGRFPVCAGAGYALGDTGGANSHTHTFTSNEHDHELPEGDDIMEGDYWGYEVNPSTVSGTTRTADGRPPYFALWFIMKI